MNSQRVLVIAYDMADSAIGSEVRELTGENGGIVFLSVAKDGTDVRSVRRRYDLTQPGAVIADEFGNLLECGLKTTKEIADALYDSDQLIAELAASWMKAIERGRLLLDQGQPAAAAQQLKVFAFAMGSATAVEGKKLFERAARAASQELDQLMGDASAAAATSPTVGDRQALRVKLTDFIAKWPRTPAAFEAEDRLERLDSSEKPGGGS